MTLGVVQVKWNAKIKIKKNKEKKIQGFNLDHPLYQLQESSTDPKYLWANLVFAYLIMWLWRHLLTNYAT